MARRVTGLGWEKLKEWEGCVLHAYDDADWKRRPVASTTPIHGTLTIGYGHTKTARPGQTITNEQAETLLRQDMADAERQVEDLVTVSLSDNQFAALVSFQFNTGAIKHSTLLKKLNAGRYDSVPAELARWNKTTINGKKVTSKGLTNRRAKEASLWATGAEIAPTRLTEPPVQPATPANFSKENIAWGASILVTVASLFNGDGPVQYALAAIFVLSFVTAMVFFINRRKG